MFRGVPVSNFSFGITKDSIVAMTHAHGFVVLKGGGIRLKMSGYGKL
jgi:hypothetical protein